MPQGEWQGCGRNIVDKEPFYYRVQRKGLNNKTWKRYDQTDERFGESAYSDDLYCASDGQSFFERRCIPCAVKRGLEW